MHSFEINEVLTAAAGVVRWRACWAGCAYRCCRGCEMEGLLGLASLLVRGGGAELAEELEEEVPAAAGSSNSPFSSTSI